MHTMPYTCLVRPTWLCVASEVLRTTSGAGMVAKDVFTDEVADVRAPQSVLLQHKKCTKKLGVGSFFRF